jgi:hypothetical protein
VLEVVQDLADGQIRDLESSTRQMGKSPSADVWWFLKLADLGFSPLRE